MSTDFSNRSDVIDIRAVFERIEELEDELSPIGEKEDELESLDPDEDKEEIRVAKEELEKLRADLENEAEELEILMAFVGEFEGYGGDEEWRGSWYPVTLVNEVYWEEFCEQECKDLGYIKDFPSWIEIDWKKTAENMQQDYTSGEYDGVTFWGQVYQK